MHIAVCDDNVADRKQLERLLGRESDKRKDTTGVFYTDSFGDCKILRKNPMQYDLFFIDLTSQDTDGLAFALELTQSGVTAPVVLCSSKINYLAGMQALASCPANLIHLVKPIQKAVLSETLDKAVALLSDIVPTIELRSETETYYVLEDDIVYGLKNGNYISVFLKDGTRVEILSDMFNFFDQISSYTHMVLLSEHALFNVAYLKSYTPFKVILKGGTEIKSSPFNIKTIKTALAVFHTETPPVV